jgi:hypothetical protein
MSSWFFFRVYTFENLKTLKYSSPFLSKSRWREWKSCCVLAASGLRRFYLSLWSSIAALWQQIVAWYFYFWPNHKFRTPPQHHVDSSCTSCHNRTKKSTAMGFTDLLTDTGLTGMLPISVEGRTSIIKFEDCKLIWLSAEQLVDHSLIHCWVRKQLLYCIHMPPTRWQLSQTQEGGTRAVLRLRSNATFNPFYDE